MEILNKLEGRVLTITPNGRLDSTTAPEFEDAINKNLNDDIDVLIIDCINIDYISSKGLRILVTAYKKMEGKSMILSNPNASVKEVLSLSGLTKVFNIK